MHFSLYSILDSYFYFFFFNFFRVIRLELKNISDFIHNFTFLNTFKNSYMHKTRVIIQSNIFLHFNVHTHTKKNCVDAYEVI